jgi:tRNA(Ile)-lysidine synthase
MAARELRYSWFEEIRSGGNYQFIALAHNMDDVIETFFINLARGTGIRGLSGIKPKKEKIIRPLLFASREEIIRYSEEKNVQFQEDSSNKKIKYIRNRIRHNIIPELVTINPRVRENILESISNLADVEKLYLQSIEEYKRDVIGRKGNSITIDIPALKVRDPMRTLLYELLRPYNFQKHTIRDIIDSLEGIAGKQFFSATHRLIKDRDELIITEIPEGERCRYYIEDDVIHIAKPIAVSFTCTNKPADLRFTNDPFLAYFDYDLLEFPLIIRKWEKGDYFQPLGMNHIKKLSDFFIDEKFSIHDKENTWLLTSGNKIIWIMGHRIDDRFKITSDSKRMFVVEIQNAET